MKTLLLTEREVRELLTMDEVIKVVESALKAKGLGHVQMPSKVYLFYKRYDGDLRAMPSYLEELDVSAVKIVNSHPGNRYKHNLPTVMAIIVLVNPKNGVPMAIMGGTWATDLRTGAAGAIAAKYLARKDSRVVGLIGAGAQARTQLEGLISIYERLEEVKVWSLPDGTKEAFVVDMKPKYGDVVKITAADDIKDAVEGADIIVTTTPSRKPLVSSNWVEAGMHLNCIGADAPGKQELDPTILTRAKIIVDDWEQASHSGEINIPFKKGIITNQNIWAEIGEVVASLKPGRTSQDEITLFTSTGLAVQDAVAANLAYEKALMRGIGQFIEII